MAVSFQPGIKGVSYLVASKSETQEARHVRPGGVVLALEGHELHEPMLSVTLPALCRPSRARSCPCGSEFQSESRLIDLMAPTQPSHNQLVLADHYL